MAITEAETDILLKNYDRLSPAMQRKAVAKLAENGAALLSACQHARELAITVLGEVKAENVRTWAEDVLEQADAAIAKTNGK